MRLGEWSHGILNSFPDHENITRLNKHNSLQQVAFMNLKKTGGKNRSGKRIIKKYTQDYLDLIHKEIAVIDPELIILGLSFWKSKSISNLIFPRICWHRIENGIDIAKYNGRKIIDFYHPSATNFTSEKFYFILKDTINFINHWNNS